MTIFIGDDIGYNIEDIGFDSNLSMFANPLSDYSVDETPESESVFIGGSAPANITAGELTAPLSVVSGHIQSSNFVTASAGWKINYDGDAEFNEGNFRGSLTAGDLHIPDENTTANSFHVETDGDAFWGAIQDDFTSDNDNALAYILKTGVAKFQSVTLGGTATAYTQTAYGIFDFGGTGTDGALDTSSGAVEIDLDGAKLVTKNYTSINIATNNLTFINAHANGTIVHLKSQGDVLVSATIDLSGLGGNKGAGASLSDGTAGTRGASVINSSLGGSGGGAAAAGTSGTGGTGGVSNSLDVLVTGRTIKTGCGSGGAGGGAASTGGIAGGAGGIGGGAIIIECRGALDFSGTITTAGDNGSNGDSDPNGSGSAGGGGAGGGGDQIIVYGTLTANTGTQTVSGGTKGNAGSGGTAGKNGAGGGGGAGSSANGDDGSNGLQGGGANTGHGGNGSVGQALVVQNGEFS